MISIVIVKYRIIQYKNDHNLIMFLTANNKIYLVIYETNLFILETIHLNYVLCSEDKALAYIQ